MRIVQVITTMSVGGAELLLVNSCNSLCERHEVHVIYLKGEAPLIDRLDSRIRHYKVPIGLNIIAKVRSLLKKIKPDVLHTHLGHADMIGLSASAGLGAKQFCTMHNIWYKFNAADRVIFMMYRLLLNTLASKCKVICISKAVQAHVISTYKLDASRAPLLYNGIPENNESLKREEARKLLHLHRDSFIILAIGRLEKQKSIETLLKAIPHITPHIPNIKVIILGKGSLLEPLTKLARQLGINGHVEFKGVASDPYPYYQAADVYVLSSIFEGLGLVILEAFRSGLPVIASNLEGPAELISSGENGLLFEPGNHVQLAQTLRQVYTDDALRKTLGKNAKASFAQQFSLSSYIAGLEQLYKS